MKLFFDSEFSGLYKDTNLISLGIISEYGHKFYGEFTDYTIKQRDLTWITSNVLTSLGDPSDAFYIKGDKSEVKNHIEKWLKLLIKTTDAKSFEFWGDVCHYDWVLFCDLWGHAFDVPKIIYYMAYDLSTLLKIKGLVPDLDRVNFIKDRLSHKGIAINRHNALDDAVVIKECYQKVLGE